MSQVLGLSLPTMACLWMSLALEESHWVGVPPCQIHWGGVTFMWDYRESLVTWVVGASLGVMGWWHGMAGGWVPAGQECPMLWQSPPLPHTQGLC